MLRLSLLAAGALLLPNVGATPYAVMNHAAGSASVANSGFPGIGLPKFLKIKTKRGAEVEVNEMKARLRELVVQEEAYYSQNKAYSRNVNRVSALSKPDSTTSSVQIEILYANSKGWTAVASHPNAPGRTCVAYVGNPEAIPMIPRTRHEGNSASMEGIPACDAAR
ncbi:MAG: hypothetical protein ACO1Q7_03560 [Gemmatimonas sp.]